MTPPIDRVVIPCYRGDYWLARICVASVRHWEGDIPITLLKDITYGDFDTTDSVKHWGVETFSVTNFGSPVAKTEVFFMSCHRALVLDADTVLLGPIIARLSAIDTDVVVSAKTVPDASSPEINENYYDWEALQSRDPGFVYPGFVFNTGQFVVRPGLITREELAPFFSQASGNLHTLLAEVFRFCDQGVLNYLWPKLAQQNRLTIGRESFALYAHPAVIGELDFPRLLREGGMPKIIHWSGPKSHDLGEFVRGDILRYYQSEFYARVPGGEAALTRDIRQGAKFRGRLVLAKRLYARLPQGLRQLAQRLLKRIVHRN